MTQIPKKPAPMPKPMILDMGLGSREQYYPLQQAPAPVKTAA